MHGFEDLLNASAPMLPENAAVRDEVDRLVGVAHLAGGRSRRLRRRVATATVAAALLGGGGAAAAAGGVWTAPWQDRPLTSISYTLPSGTTCSQEIANLRMSDPGARAVVSDWLASGALNELIDVPAALAELRAEPWTWTVDGHRVKVGYGTAHYDPDYEYDSAVWLATSRAIREKLADAGYTAYVDYGWSTEATCTGPNPSPGVPSWAK